MDVDVSDTPELSGGGGPQSVPSRISVVLVEEAMAGALHVWGAHVMTRGNDSRLEGLFATTVLDCRPLRGRCPIPGLPVLMLQMHQHFRWGASVGPSRISVVLVDEANAGGTPGQYKGVY